MVKQLEDGEQDQAETEEVKEPTVPKIKLNPEELSQYESGLIIFRVIDVDLARSDCTIEVTMDDSAYPAWRSSRIRTKTSTLNETGDAIVREIDFSKITVRLREKGGDDDDDKVYSKSVGPTIEVLKRHLVSYRSMLS